MTTYKHNYACPIKHSSALYIRSLVPRPIRLQLTARSRPSVQLETDWPGNEATLYVTYLPMLLVHICSPVNQHQGSPSAAIFTGNMEWGLLHLYQNWHAQHEANKLLQAIIYINYIQKREAYTLLNSQLDPRTPLVLDWTSMACA